MIHHIAGLYIANSLGKGRGVFTTEAINVGDLIETSPVILIPPKDLEKIHTSALHDYYFLWAEQYALALGYGSLYNHSENANAEFVLDFDQQSIDFKCIDRIEVGEEILVDYNAGAEKGKTLWFSPIP